MYACVNEGLKDSNQRKHLLYLWKCNIGLKKWTVTIIRSRWWDKEQGRLNSHLPSWRFFPVDFRLYRSQRQYMSQTPLLWGALLCFLAQSSSSTSFTNNDAIRILAASQIMIQHTELYPLRWISYHLPTDAPHTVIFEPGENWTETCLPTFSSSGMIL